MNTKNPFIDGRFKELLEKSQSIGQNTGWIDSPLNDGDYLHRYVKTHSYGEYIFDWSWADFYQRYGVQYYPKIVHAIPFTPVNAPKLIGADKNEQLQLAVDSFEEYQSKQVFSGEHYLFINQDEADILSSIGFEIMETHQYHWLNTWESFEHFLDTLKKGRRKMIKKERRKIAEYGIEIRTYQGNQCHNIMTLVYDLYLATISKKNAHAYLQRGFFELLPNFMEEGLIINIASFKNEKIAMSIFIESDDTLYGRYWGILPKYENEFPALHFEMCYYQGMQRCFEKGHHLFEAGAQGEHKLWRGFHPVKILSAHHLRHADFFPPIKEYIREQNKENYLRIEHLKQFLPYKS